MEATAALFIVSARINTREISVEVPLARPLEYRDGLDSEFETFQCRVINAHTLSGDLPAELEPYRGWYISDVKPLFSVH